MNVESTNREVDEGKEDKKVTKPQFCIADL